MSNFISDEKFDLILNLMVEGFGIREIARQSDVARNTARKWWRIYYSLPDGEKPPNQKCGYWKLKKNKKGFIFKYNSIVSRGKLDILNTGVI